MYNLLVSANKKSYENDVPFKLETKRIFEHTNSDIKEKYKDLPLDNIKNFPCIFSYEKKCEKNPKFGYITNIRKSAVNAIFIEYKIIDFKKSLSYLDLSDMSSDLDIDEKFEMNRTHWAIKDVDLSKELKKKGIILPNIINVDTSNKHEMKISPIHTQDSFTVLGDYFHGDKIGHDKNINQTQNTPHWFKRPEIIIPIIIAIISIPWWPNLYKNIVGSPIITITSNQELASTTPNLLDIYKKAFSYDILADRQDFFGKYKDSKIYGDGTVREISSLNNRYILDINIGSYSVLCPQERTEDFERLYPLLKGKKVRFYGIFTYSNYFGYDNNAIVIDQCSFERK